MNGNGMNGNGLNGNGTNHNDEKRNKGPQVEEYSPRSNLVLRNYLFLQRLYFR